MTEPPPTGLGSLTATAITTHEIFKALREAGCTRPEALYIVTRPAAEIARMEWCAAHRDGGNP